MKTTWMPLICQQDLGHIADIDQSASEKLFMQECICNHKINLHARVLNLAGYTEMFVCLFDLILYVPSTIFQLKLHSL